MRMTPSEDLVDGREDLYEHKCSFIAYQPVSLYVWMRAKIMFLLEIVFPNIRNVVKNKIQ